MVGGGVIVAVDDNCKDDDGSTSSPTPTTRPPSRAALPLKVLLLAVLTAGFLAVIVIFLSGFTYSTMLPRFSMSTPSSSSPTQLGKATLERWITTRAPAATAWHDMTDDELRWAASWRPTIAGYPYKRVPKVAFMFLTRGPLPLAPLWDKFFSGAGDDKDDLYSVYVHAMPEYHSSSDDDEFPPASAFHRRHVPSKVVDWGEVNTVDAERRLLANALLDVDNDRFVLLSEACVPLFNFSVVYQYITSSDHSFVGAVDEPGPGGRGRYSDELAPEVTPEQWRKGPEWFELQRDLAVLLVADDRYYPKFSEHCRTGCFSDEPYLQTMLSIEAPDRIANRSLTWTDWTRGGAHPATFGEADIDEAFLKRLTTDKGQGKCTYNGQPVEVCFLFARKLAPNALQPLLNLAPKMLGHG